MDSPTSNNSLRRWQTALAAFCQPVSSVATVRLTWTKTWLLPKLRAEGRLPKLVQLATPVTGWWMLVEECACQKEVIRNWTGSQRETTTDLTWHNRRFGRHSSRNLQAPQLPSQFAKCHHLTHSHVRQVFITDCRKPEVVQYYGGGN